MRLIKSFHYAFAGIDHALKEHTNLRIHLLAGIVATIAGIFFNLSSWEWAILALTIFIVILAEMLNTSIEAMVDLITKEHREEARIAKDVAAGMVLVAAIGSLLIGFLIFYPHIIRLF